MGHVTDPTLMTSDYADIIGELKTRLAAHAPSGTVIEEDTDLATELALDSLKLIDLSLEIEDEFDVSVSLEELANVRTPRELAELIANKH